MRPDSCLPLFFQSHNPMQWQASRKGKSNETKQQTLHICDALAFSCDLILHNFYTSVSFKEKIHRGGIDIQTWCRALLVCSNNICSNNIWWISGHVLWEADFSVDMTNFQSQPTPLRKIMMIKLKVKSLPLFPMFDLTIVAVQASLCLKRLQKGCSTVHNKSWQNCCQRCNSCQEFAVCQLLMKIDIVLLFKLPPCYVLCLPLTKRRHCFQFQDLNLHIQRFKI